MHPRPRTRQIDIGLAPVDLGRLPGRMDLRNEHLPRPLPQLTPPPADVIADGRLSDLETVLVDQPAPHTLWSSPALVDT